MVTLPVEAADLVRQAAAGSVRATARLLSRIEAGGASAASVARALAGRPRSAEIWGVTGAPGVGKSTLSAALIAALRAAGRSVGVLAVDPSSPLSGGALLGDRVRMADHVTDPGVFIRSLATRGQLGGISRATPAAVDLLSALGFDVVLVETVGVGQNEVDVLRLADTVVVVTAPGAGDGIQAAKAGILEIADILVVNKGDRDGAAGTVRELRSMVSLGRVSTGGPVGSGSAGGDRHRWRVPVLITTATSAAGVAELLTALADHRDRTANCGEATARQERRAGAVVEALVAAHLHQLIGSADGRVELSRAAGLAADTGDAGAGAAQLWSWVGRQALP